MHRAEGLEGDGRGHRPRRIRRQHRPPDMIGAQEIRHSARGRGHRHPIEPDILDKHLPGGAVIFGDPAVLNYRILKLTALGFGKVFFK